MARGIDKGANPNEQDYRGETALHDAVGASRTEENRFETIKRLLQARADVTLKNKNGESPMNLVKSAEDSEIAGLLMTAETEQLIDKKSLPLAYEHKRFDVILDLIDRGISIDQPNSDSRTILHLAVLSRKIEDVEHFIGCGADVNKPGLDGRTALHETIRYKPVDSPRSPEQWRDRGNLITLLLAKGADLMLKDDEGNTPVDFMRDKDRHDFAPQIKVAKEKMLKVSHHSSDNAEGDKEKLLSIPFHEAAEKNNLPAIKAWLKNGGDIHAKDEEGKTVLHHAIKSILTAHPDTMRSHQKLIEFLVAEGADPDAKAPELVVATRDMDIPQLGISAKKGEKYHRHVGGEPMFKTPVECIRADDRDMVRIWIENGQVMRGAKANNT